MPDTPLPPRIPGDGDVVIPDDVVQIRRTEVDGVFEGGGALGAAYSGALRLLEEDGVWFKRVAGTSAGAITAALIAAGYTAREIDWLMSAHGNAGPPPTPRLRAEGALPIEFLRFLDPIASARSISDEAMRRTPLHRSLKGDIIDRVLEQELPLLPSRKDVVDAIVIQLGAFGVPAQLAQGLRGFLNEQLSFLNEERTHLRDINPWTLPDLRQKFADEVWRFIAGRPITGFVLRQETQLYHEGSLFLGENFRQTMKQLLNARLGRDPVRFKDLPIPLVVLAANLRTRTLEVYSRGTSPLMLVAEAVRRSMSIPIAFEPMVDLIVDGGVYSNFPAWTLSSAHDDLWPDGTPDSQRPKIGFVLEDAKAPPRSWRLSRPKFAVEGDPPDPPAVDTKDVLQSVLLAAAGLPGFPPVGFDVDLLLDNAPLRLLEVIFKTSEARSSSQDLTREQLTEAVFAGSPYYDIQIPLLGFHWLDFAINLVERDLNAIRQRGWYAAQEVLGNPRGGLPRILSDRARTSPNPYLR